MRLIIILGLGLLINFGEISCVNQNKIDLSAANNVQLKDFWIKQPKNNMAEMYGTIKNVGNRTIWLKKVSTQVAVTTDLCVIKQGIVDSLKSGFRVRPAKILILQPQRAFIKLMDLKQTLQIGQTVKVKLEFSDGSFYELTPGVKPYYDSYSTISGAVGENK